MSLSVSMFRLKSVHCCASIQTRHFIAPRIIAFRCYQSSVTDIPLRWPVKKIPYFPLLVAKPGDTFQVIDAVEPSSLMTEDFLDLSGLKNPSIRTRFEKDKSLDLTYAFVHNKLVPFPPRTAGFLYFHKPLCTPNAAGEIRFRRTKWNDPNLIIHERSSDLCLPNGAPWSLPLVRIAIDDRLAPLRDLILREQLVTETIMRNCEEWASPHAAILTDETRYNRVIHSLGQLFALDLSQEFFDIWLLTSKRLVRVVFNDVFGTPDPPFRGHIVCYFEKGKHFSKESVEDSSAGKSICIRILKIMTPVTHAIPNYNAIRFPREGKLLMRLKQNITIGKKSSVQWNYLLDTGFSPLKSIYYYHV